ncbi:hypothetical protein [Paraburkholderia atlantica]|uniref:hypothetical protein n=1 Tax=Paraburkholderia atlantica TaxID=2654982 RepID=UPI000379DA8F|nr:hypothetical protein [Paraburkholderia atlantica]
MLTISIYDGEYDGDLSALAHMCDVDGPVECDLCNALVEALRVLKLCTKPHDVPRLTGAAFTVFVGRKSGEEVVPLARMDVLAHNGTASASVSDAGPRWDTEPAYYAPGDDAVEIVRKILTGQLIR